MQPADLLVSAEHNKELKAVNPGGFIPAIQADDVTIVSAGYFVTESEEAIAFATEAALLAVALFLTFKAFAGERQRPEPGTRPS